MPTYIADVFGVDAEGIDPAGAPRTPFDIIADAPPEVSVGPALAGLTPRQAFSGPELSGFGASAGGGGGAFGFEDGFPTTATLDRLVQVESGGDPNAVSPVGATGPVQIMPDTARAPGFGVPPIPWSQVRDPNHAIPWARKYLGAMYRRYQNPAAALAAYNAGPGTVDAALAGAGFGALPAETRGYVQKFGYGPGDF